MNAERLAEIRELAAKTQSAVGMECLAYIDELRAQLEAQRGEAVVVPELKDTDPEWQDVAFRGDGHRNAPIAKAFTDGYALAVSRIQPIPASQVLQPGMVGVDREEWKAAEDFATRYAGDWSDDALKPYWLGWQTFRALRSQAGGEG